MLVSGYEQCDRIGQFIGFLATFTDIWQFFSGHTAINVTGIANFLPIFGTLAEILVSIVVYANGKSKSTNKRYSVFILGAIFKLT